MTRTWSYLALALVLVIVLVVGWWALRPGDGAPAAVDLVDRFPEAEKRTTLDNLRDAFKVIDVTIDGETKGSIFAHAFSRIIWRIDVPRGALLQTSLALHPDVWDEQGDGVIFRIGISDGATYEELLNQHVDPINNPADRRWLPVGIDLSPYAGQQVQLIFNTDAGPTGDASYDWALWGAPRLVAAETE